ncbi:ANTAR domain-containing protein [Amycolatopsis sp. NPDC026612]|uniref:ANTAR domain-containing protein n=1 Tax=Amycolatopsis sp. NPDC026612 TaxID=3155466 RepID=UPI00341159B9
MTSEGDWERDKRQFVADAHGDVAADAGPAGPGPLARQFATLTAKLLDTTTVAGALENVVRTALAVVPGADLVSVTLLGPEGSFHTPVETDDVATVLDQVQYRLHEGPCVDAARSPGPAVAISDDLSVERKWPRFGPLAAQRGVSSVVSTALLPSSRSPQLNGALNVYSKSPRGLDATDREIALLLASHASLALAATHAVTTAELQTAHLRKALESRDVIGQAKGILMQRQGIGAEEAFDILRRTSQELNVKLVKLAETLTTRHTELGGRDRAT